MVRQRLTPQPSRLLKRHRASALPLYKAELALGFFFGADAYLQARTASAMCIRWQLARGLSPPAFLLQAFTPKMLGCVLSGLAWWLCGYACMIPS